MDHEANFGVQLAYAFRKLIDELHAHLDEAGFPEVRQTFGYAFKVLASESLTTSQLAARVGITHQGAAKTVEEMVAEGYVERVPDPADRRTKRLVLTEKARALLAAGDRFHREYERELAERLGAEKVAAAREVFAAMIARPAPEGVRAVRATPPLV